MRARNAEWDFMGRTLLMLALSNEALRTPSKTPDAVRVIDAIVDDTLRLEADRDEHPINCVDWHQARAFAAWVGGRLLTEAEWMFAARDGGPARSYPWGSAKLTCAHARHLACGEGTASVCAADLGLTDAGLCDLLGNVWEWVEDAREDDAPFQVLKGGGFDGARSVTDRVRASPGLRFPGYGFRVVRTVGDDE